MTLDVRDYIYSNGRLLERELYSLMFEEGENFENALLAYKNSDGGFGNGIEPDLMCPMSSMIGTETALYYMDISGIKKDQIVKDSLHWLERLIDTKGEYAFPTEDMLEYPHQPWWENPDDKRVFVIYALLKKQGVEHPDLERRLIERYLKLDIPEKLSFYDYIYYMFARYVLKDEALTKGFVEKFMVLLEEEKTHYPLFSRHWYTIMDYIDKDVIMSEFATFLDGIHREDIAMPYPQLPWWTPIMVLDGLMIAERYELLGDENE